MGAGEGGVKQAGRQTRAEREGERPWGKGGGLGRPWREVAGKRKREREKESPGASLLICLIIPDTFATRQR